MTTEPATTIPCPRCGALGLPIVYGLPGPDLFEAAERGEVALGGCELSFDNPLWRCSSGECRWEF